MPHKYNADRRNGIPKQKYRVTNWAGYNEGLRRRVDLTVWITDAAAGLWSAPRRTTRGGQPRHSDLAIELCLTLGMVFNQPLIFILPWHSTGAYEFEERNVWGEVEQIDFAKRRKC